jgi:O-antigen/teichoic acid export membrane protein
MIVLVRLLAPESYGQFGLVTSIVGFLSVFSYRRFLEYTLQIRPGPEVDYQLYFTAGVYVQICLFLFANLAAGALKYSRQYGPVAPLVHLMSLLFLFDLGHDFRMKMLERDMNWIRLRILEGIGIVAGAIVSVTMATAGAGVYALLVPSLVTSVPAIVDLVFVEHWRPTWIWDPAAFAPARRYGLTRLISAALICARPLIESTVLVRLAGFAIYGIYGRSLGLATICCLKVPTLLGQALFPVLTKLDPKDESYRQASTLVFCSVAWPTFPIAIILSSVASPIVHYMYGDRWSSVTLFLPWAMASFAITALVQTGSLLLLAGLQQTRTLCLDGITLAGTALGLLALAPRGLVLYLIGSAAVQLVIFVLMLASLYRSQSISFQGIVRSLILPALAAGSTFGILKFAFLGILIERLPAAILYAALFCAIYGLILRLTSRELCLELVHLLPGCNYLQRWLLLGSEL